MSAVKTYLNPMKIPAVLLSKYDQRGPRYTSYPTAPQFSDDFDIPRVEALWDETNGTGNGLSLYTHFPFCRTRCLYCGCFTEVKHSESIRNAYLSILKREVEQLFSIIASSRSVQQLALGGGTPTYMKTVQLADYIRHLKNHVDFSPDAELSLEIDPRGVNKEDIDGLVEAGFNRFSFGVQDLDPAVQDIIQRPLSEDGLHQLLSHLRKRGVDAINLDLIYGLPGQTPASIGRTIMKIIELRPSRIALFGYAHVPWVSPHQKALEKYHIPNPEERMRLFGTAFNLLLDSGYEHVGMDHFALPEDDLLISLKNRTLTRNFMGYTTRRGLDLVGIGTSSISSVGRTYVQNGKDVPGYIEKRENLHWEKGLILSDEDLLRREIILDLFCNFYLDTGRIERKWDIVFGDHFAEELHGLRPMKEDGLIKLDNDNLEVTELGRFFIRNICMVFDQYIKGEETKGRYSKIL